MLQEVVALADLGRSPVRPLKPPVKRGVLVVELVGRNPVVFRHGIVGQIDEQLLQRSILWRQRIGRGRIVAAVGVCEEHLGIVLGGVVKLRGAVELIDAGDKVSGEALERNGPLILRQDNVGQLKCHS